MSGRGAYYKEKYGGGRGGRGYGRGEGYGGRGEGGRGGRGFGRGRGRGHHGYGGHHGHGGVKEAPTFFDNLPSGAVQDESGEFTFENEDKRARHTASSDRLENLLADLDNAPYGLYKRLYDSNYQFRSPFPFVLQFSHIQGKPSLYTATLPSFSYRKLCTNNDPSVFLYLPLPYLSPSLHLSISHSRRSLCGCFPASRSYSFGEPRLPLRFVRQ